MRDTQQKRETAQRLATHAVDALGKLPVGMLSDLILDNMADVKDTTESHAIVTWLLDRPGCGCCRLGCVCWHHRDIPRGIRVVTCKQHDDSKVKI